MSSFIAAISDFLAGQLQQFAQNLAKSEKGHPRRSDELALAGGSRPAGIESFVRQPPPAGCGGARR